MSDSAATREVVRAFRIHGLQLRGEAVRKVVDAKELILINGGTLEDFRDTLDLLVMQIKGRIENRELKSVMIDSEAIGEGLQALQTGSQLSHVDVIDAFKCSRLYVDPLRKSLRVELPGEKQRRLHADPASKGQMMRDRFLLVQHRLKRHPNFRGDSQFQFAGAKDSASSGGNKIELTPLGSLLGTAGSKYILGTIVQDREGSFALEDLTTSVPLDLSKLEKVDPFVTEMSIVVIEGYMEDGKLVAIMVYHPPMEGRLTTQQHLGQVDAFGGEFSRKELAELEAAGKQQNIMAVFVSDCHLDRQDVLERLVTLFAGFESAEDPVVFVLMGNFSSVSVTHESGDVARIKASFEALGDAIAKTPKLAREATFVLVPGPGDPGMGGCLPYPPLPEYFAATLRGKVANIELATNPCRIRLFDQHVVVFREDILRKMQRHCVVRESAMSEDISEGMVQALVQQGHLCPLPLIARPINWEFDGALSLFPLPDVIVLADRTEQYRFTMDANGRTTATNPGFFPSESAFVVYHTMTKEVEFSRIPGAA